ncbi:MAG: NAD(P)/FAD-dependent oxidoreductase [Phycisphaerae bacterium]
MTQGNGTVKVDVAIIGGGPGGSTTGSLIKKYNPDLSVLILEKEQFPRDHVGESQLPAIAPVLQEMGAWQAIEAADFPIKIGATYTWGKTTEPWIFEFVPIERIPPQAEIERPGKYEDWRLQTAFQVDRAVYDDVLLKHAAKLGCDVRQSTRVAEVLTTDDHIDGLKLDSGEVIRATHYVDASGNAAILRRAMDVSCEVPTKLKNVAFWDYWENREWADADDVKATRVHIRSLAFGWLWWIRLSPTRVSIGLVCPGEYFKTCGKKPAELYEEAVRSEKTYQDRLRNAKQRGKVEGTTDWSFVVERTYGENWFLVGECAGFADPILAAGLTLTHVGARDLAYTILELERGEFERDWLVERYDELQTRRVRQHMKFADFWYSANGIFEDIREHCTEIAAEAGFKLDPVQAFRWLSQGGLGDDFVGQAGIGGHDLASMKQVMMRMTEGNHGWMIDGKTHFELNLANAKEGTLGVPVEGRIHRVRSWTRKGQTLAEVGIQKFVIEALRQTNEAGKFMQVLAALVAKRYPKPEEHKVAVHHAVQVLEALAQQYWVICDTKKKHPAMRISSPEEGQYIHSDRGEATVI